MIKTIIEPLQTNRITRYRFETDGKSLSFGEALLLWKQQPSFRTQLTKTLVDSPFEAFRWETPALSSHSLNQAFEFVLLNTPIFTTRRTDIQTFNEYFQDKNKNICTINNLSGDACLIIPTPQENNSVYGHFASFLRGAPQRQIDLLWLCIGTEMTSRLRNNNKPIWLSTAGGGVAWLHVRIDSRPKYYGHQPYTIVGK